MKTISDFFNKNEQVIKRSVFLSISFINVFFYTRYYDHFAELGAIFYLFVLINLVFFGFCMYKFLFYDKRGFVYIALGVALFFVNVFYLRSLKSSVNDTLSIEGIWLSDDSLGLTLRFEFMSTGMCFIAQSPDYENVEYKFFTIKDSLYILDYETKNVRFSFKVEDKSSSSMILEMEDESIALRKSTINPTELHKKDFDISK